jgi:hypothetical protein
MDAIEKSTASGVKTLPGSSSFKMTAMLAPGAFCKCSYKILECITAAAKSDLPGS